ncbi:Kat8 Regulatory Nsl Complex Subunit 3 [Manis pentadactyla]|nr:Kat8 Regulatory Nsl Complex Subunit 3 [Manis pentadactyla]
MKREIFDSSDIQVEQNDRLLVRSVSTTAALGPGPELVLLHRGVTYRLLHCAAPAAHVRTHGFPLRLPGCPQTSHGIPRPCATDLPRCHCCATTS